MSVTLDYRRVAYRADRFKNNNVRSVWRASMLLADRSSQLFTFVVTVVIFVSLKTVLQSVFFVKQREERLINHVF